MKQLCYICGDKHLTYNCIHSQQCRLCQKSPCQCQKQSQRHEHIKNNFENSCYKCGKLHPAILCDAHSDKNKQGQNTQQMQCLKCGSGYHCSYKCPYMTQTSAFQTPFSSGHKLTQIYGH